LLHQRLGTPQIATGDMLRAAIASGSPLGQEANRYVRAGDLVPDAVMIGIVAQRLASSDAAIGFILDVYRIERAALDADLLGTPEHLEMRQTQSKGVMDEFRTWLVAEKNRHPPRGPLGEAISYALGQWDPLTLFLTDPHLPIDNNASERALRVAATRGSLCSTPSSTRNSKRACVRRIATRASTLSACA